MKNKAIFVRHLSRPMYERWKAVHDEAKKKHGLLFGGWQITRGGRSIGWGPFSNCRASCCVVGTSEAEMNRHLATLEHFRRWCLDHPAVAGERFPESSILVTEEVLIGDV